MLSEANSHPRDNLITFEESNHQYTIQNNECKPTSVTTLIHKFFPEFNADLIISKMMKSKNWPNSKYFGMTPKEIKDLWEKNRDEAANLGTKMHANIENYFNGLEHFTDTKEFSLFQDFWTNFCKINSTLTPYRTEWVVYDEECKIAGSIDFVLKNQRDELVLIDWKRSKEIKKENRFQKGLPPFQEYDDCNYNHYRLQLNFYRHILETKYNQKIAGMLIVVLHPNQDKYQCHHVDKIELGPVWKSLNN